MRLSRALVAGCALTLAAAPLSAASAQEVQPARVAGPDRWATAAAIARFLYPDGVSEAVLGSGLDFPDTLAGAPLASANSSPVLLTDPDVVPQPTLDALSDLGVNQVTLLGGEDAISAEVAQDLEARGYVVGRVAGTNRWETAAELARAVYAENAGANFPGGRRAVFVTNGLRFPDALAASAPASAGPSQIPIVLTEEHDLPPATAQVLQDLDVELAVLVGGPSAIDESVRQAIEDLGVDTDRVFGLTRTDTAASVAVYAQEFLGFDATSYLLARGDEFPDALAAGPLGGVRSDPILLTRDPDTLTSATRDHLARMCPDVDVVRAVGGKQAVRPETLQDAEDAAESCRSDSGATPQDGQTFLVSPQEGVTLSAGEEFTFTVATRYDDQPFTGPVDIALLPCESAEVLGSGDDVFTDADGDGAADRLGETDTGAAVIASVNGAATVEGATVVRDQGPDADGDLDATVRADAADCAVVLFYEDVDDDGQFDVTAEARAGEPYGVGRVSWS